MKTSLKILAFVVALAAMTACSAQKRAERQVRKAVALCPELVQVKAHPVDTVLTAKGFVDVTHVSLPELLHGDTTYAAAEHGTVVVNFNPADSTLRVGFVAMPQKVHYQDTLRYQQVVLGPKADKRSTFWSHFALCLVGFVVGIGLCCWIYSLLKKR